MDTPPASQPAPAPAAPKTPGLAIASLVLGIISLLGAAVFILPTILAIVFGHVAYARIQKDRGLTGAGLAVAGFVLGYVSIFFAIFWLGMLAAMAIPAFEKVREESTHKMLQNDARQIGAAAQQYMLENGEQPVVFHIDPQTGAVTGPLSAYIRHLSPGTTEVDGRIENSRDDFSLENPHYRRGQPVVFDAEGREK